MEEEKKALESTAESSTENTEEKDEATLKAEEQQRAQLSSALKMLSRRYEFADPELLTTWYKLDSNAKPPVYRLQKIR